MSANGSVLIVVDIAADDHPRLRENGFGRVDDRSWFEGKRKDQGFEQLLRDCGLEIQTPVALHQVTVSVESATTTISDYFSHFVLRLHARSCCSRTSRSGHPEPSALLSQHLAYWQNGDWPSGG